MHQIDMWVTAQHAKALERLRRCNTRAHQDGAAAARGHTLRKAAVTDAQGSVSVCSPDLSICRWP